MEELAIIAHGTNGGDNIIHGIHLRWQFDPRLGFPPQGFRLYRRDSCSGEMPASIDFSKMKVGPVPTQQNITATDGVNKYNVGIQSSQGKNVAIGTLKVDGTGQQNFLSVNDSVDIILPGAQEVQIYLSIQPKGSATLTATNSDGSIIEKHTTDGTTAGPVYFSAQGIAKISVQGTNIYIAKIIFYTCQDCKNPWGVVNRKCGFGLPVIPPVDGTQFVVAREPTPYYFILGDDGLKVDPCNPEWSIAQCRLPKNDWCKLEGKAFDDLTKILYQLVEYANNAPMGALQLIYDADPPQPQTQTHLLRFQNQRQTLQQISTPSPKFNMPALDMILTAALNPDIAMLLGLYWIDTTAQPGKFYDYKVEANWPAQAFWDPDNSIDFEDEEPQVKPNIFSKDGLVFLTFGLVTVRNDPSILAQTQNGLHIKGDVEIVFPTPVHEIQVFVKGKIGTTLEALPKSNPPNLATLSKPEGVLTVSSNGNITSVVLIGTDFTIYKMSWCQDLIVPHDYTAQICHVSIVNNPPLPSTPTGLVVQSSPGMTRTQDDGTVVDQRFRAGLVWDIPRDKPDQLFADAPVMYHAWRTSPWGGNPDWLTKNSPIKITDSVLIAQDDSRTMIDVGGKLVPRRKTPFFYYDALGNGGEYSYAIAAVDIWGRMSDWTQPAKVTLQANPPPPPANVEAKYLDPNDPTLSGSEKTWIANNGNNPSLKVRWQWNDPLQRQAPDVSSFNIYFQPGWLNVIQSTIDQDPTETGTFLDLHTAYVNKNIQDDIFKDEVLQMNLMIYDIIGSKTDAGGNVILRINKPIPSIGDFIDIYVSLKMTNKLTKVAEPDDKHLILTIDYNCKGQDPTLFIGKTAVVDYVSYNILDASLDGNNLAVTVQKHYPKNGDSFSVPVTNNTPPPQGVFNDYKVPQIPPWKTKLQSQVVNIPSQVQYEVILSNLPPELKDFSSSKVQYAQIGISSVSVQGEGRVSSPATVISICRDPAKNISSGEVAGLSNPITDIPDIDAPYATIPDYHGKSSFAFRWKKQDDETRFFVYRAMDETLFNVDANLRSATDSDGKLLRSRNPADYQSFLQNYDAGVQDLIKKYVLQPPSIDYVQLYGNTSSNGSPPQDILQHKNVLLQALASLPGVSAYQNKPAPPGNETAFSKLHSQAILPDDPNYANRNTDIPAAGTQPPAADPSLLLYLDDTLDGRGKNFYFYRVRTVNDIGSLGSFSPSSPPVYLPKITPPVTPRITSAVASDNGKITISWSPNNDPNLSRYLVYRTDSENFSSDIRRMKKISDDTPANYKTNYGVNQRGEPQFIDIGLQGKTIYYYRVVAMDTILNAIDGGGNSLDVRSPPSNPVACQAYDLSPPTVPIVITTKWIHIAPDGSQQSWDAVPPAGQVWTDAILIQWQCNNPLNVIIERQTDNTSNFWSTITSFLPADQTNYIDNNLDKSKTFTYRLRGRNVSGNLSDYGAASVVNPP